MKEELSEEDYHIFDTLKHSHEAMIFSKITDLKKSLAEKNHWMSGGKETLYQWYSQRRHVKNGVQRLKTKNTR